MQSTLIIQAARFGDLLQTKRLILSLAKEHTVHLVVDRSLHDLAAFLYPTARIHSLFLHGTLSPEALAENEKTFAALADCSFSSVYNCNLSGLANAVTHLFPETIRKGYRPLLQGTERSPLLQIVARMTAQRQYASVNLEDVWAHLVQNPIAVESVNPLPTPKGGGLGVVLSGREERRSLAPELLAELVTLYARLNDLHPIVLLGTSAEKKAAYAVRSLLPASLQGEVQDLCGKTSFVDLCALLSSLDLVLTPDTGTMHLACHCGTPVRAFFLSSALCHETGPYGIGQRVFQVQPPCAPCLETAPCTQNLCCHKALQGKAFLKAVADIEQGKKNVTIPPHVQYLEAHADAFGLTFALQEGTDPFARERAFLRAIVLEKFCAGPSLLPRTDKEKELLASIFVQDSDWMLEPDRYR